MGKAGADRRSGCQEDFGNKEVGEGNTNILIIKLYLRRMLKDRSYDTLI